MYKLQVASTQLTPGFLEVILLEVSRLNLDPGTITTDNCQTEIYCTMSVDSTPWVYLTQYSGVPYMVLDLIISKTSSQQLGVVFKQEAVFEIGLNCVLVETIVAGSPASIAEMKRGDILVAVNGKKVSNMNQVAKLVKSATQRRFIIRVERKYVNWTKIDFERNPFDRNFDRKSSKSDSGISKGEPAGFEEVSKPRIENQIKFSDFKEPEFESLEKGETVSKLFKRRKSSAHNPVVDDVFQTPETPSRRISTTSNLSSSSSNAQSFGDEIYTPNLTDLYYTTKEKELASVITFDETRTFQIDSEHQYLNIGVWSRIKGGECPPKLLGYINAPIKLILAQCSTSSTGHYLKWHALLPPDSATTASVNLKLQGYSGFDPTLCYGDILLSYGWVSSISHKQNAEDNIKKESGESIKVQSAGNEEHVVKKHDFIRTHFHRATHCDFCTKKIWLKDAVQCRDCGLVCHKKCESRCLASGACGAESLSTLAFEADEVEIVAGEAGPEISLTGCEETVQGAGMTAMKASIANTLLGLKKAGSTSCLAPPTAGTGLASRSLPPSPCASRKSSLVGGLGISPDLLEGAEPSVASTLLAGDLDDGLMTKAKDTGKHLYKYLEPQDRIDKINLMITKLKTALDVETTSRVELSQSSESDTINLIAQSDLRVQALSVLLLHYCTGLQHAQEALERPKIDKGL